MDGFREIYDRYHLDVRRFALFLTGDPARADDLAADTFVRAWQARDRIRHATVKAYLMTITRNLYRDQLRSSRKSAARQVELEDTIADSAPRVDVHVQHASTLREVRLRLRRVARGDRRALLLYVVKEMLRRGGGGARHQHRRGEVAHRPLRSSLSFRIKPDSWWRPLAGLDDETLAASGLRRRNRRRQDA